MEILLGLVGVALGIWYARRQFYKNMKPPANAEKPGYIYFIENQKNPGRIKILKQQKKLVTPLRIVEEFPASQPNTVLQQIYRDLEEFHIGAGWYDGDATRMYLDHLKGTA